ncbi:MAG: bifunctional 4-hydroxy-2-oxoglutarate aldolase/2-dehydro-3-deoxy-phosphogluconate aldolase [Halobacteriota archaeon]
MSASARRAVLQRILDSGVVAVVRGADADTAVDTVSSLVDGGVTAVELTVDTPGALDLISDVAGSVGDEALVGAGTVLDGETARSALLAGAEFVVSPTLDVDLVETCNRYDAVCAPGVMTPTEALRATEAGADIVKVFPASTLGPGHLAAMRGPLPQIQTMPTGGLDRSNVGEFVRAGAAVVGVGSALVDRDAVEAGDFATLTENARAFVDAVEAARGE